MADISRLAELEYEWMQECETRIRENGEPLSDERQQLAETVGVQHAENVRVLHVETLPLPENETLKQFYLENNIHSATSNGRTRGYGIFIKNGPFQDDNRLYAHELVHVAQIERLGRKRFIKTYFQQVLDYGYTEAPLEVAAREKGGYIPLEEAREAGLIN